MAKKTETNTLILLLHQILNSMDVNELIAKLQEIKEPEFKKIIDYILKQSATRFSVSEHDIRFSTKRGIVSDAKKVTAIILKTHLPMSEIKIGRFFGGKTRQAINKCIKDMEKLEPNSKNRYEKELYEKYQEINGEVQEFKNKLLLKNKIK